MAQVVVRIDDELAARVDQLVEQGLVASRSEAVRRGLESLVDEHRRRRVAEEIVRGYRERPQGDDEIGWADAATVGMIADEPW